MTVLVVAVLLGLGVVVVRTGGTTARPTGSPGSATSARSAAPQTTAPRTTSSRATTPPTSSRTAVPSTTAPSATAPSTTRTAPRPTPPPGPQPVEALGDNPLFGGQVGLAGTGCTWPDWAPDPDSQQAFLRGAVDCIGQTWRAPLAGQGLPWAPTDVVLYGSQVSTPCGVEGVGSGAFYCPGSDTVYLSTGFADLSGLGAGDQGVFLSAVAHEYGHRVQDLSGVSSAYARQRYDAGDPYSEAGLLLSRRLELQATCFDGMFYAGAGPAVPPTTLQVATDDSRRRGDAPGRPRDHGEPQHNGAWFAQGLQRNLTYQCNTWRVDAADVS